MFKTTLALIGGAFLIYQGCTAYSRMVEKKYKAAAFDAIRAAARNTPPATPAPAVETP